MLVFEDIKPRFVDLGEECHLVMVVESHQNKGARLVIYDANGRTAYAPYIGTRYRWLAPIGVADLDGDGLYELAYIDRPHLARRLVVLQWQGRGKQLKFIAEKHGLTNHRIGDEFIFGGIANCPDGKWLITADARWQHGVAIQWHKGQLHSRKIGELPRYGLAIHPWQNQACQVR